MVENRKPTQFHHGSKHPLYKVWIGMMYRCYNPKAAKYPLYGGRGITVSERWHNFQTFVADVGSRPAGTTLDRRDNNGNYGPDNCRWATSVEQNRNRRFVGVHLSRATGKWRAAIKFEGRVRYLGEFVNRDDALVARKKAEVELWKITN